MSNLFLFYFLKKVYDVFDIWERIGILCLVMNKYALIKNLSVVVHQRLLHPRLSPFTEKARVEFLDALLAETEARNNSGLFLMSPRDKGYDAAYKKLQPLVSETCVASKLYFAQAEKDNRLVPTFWVVG